MLTIHSDFEEGICPTPTCIAYTADKVSTHYNHTIYLTNPNAQHLNA